MKLGSGLLDRYILGQLVQPFIFGTGVVAGVWFGASELRAALSLMASASSSIFQILFILCLSLPKIFADSIPVGLLIATYLVFNRLCADSEIVVLRVAGVSFYRLMLAPMAVGIVASLVIFVLGEYIVPVSNRVSDAMKFYAKYKVESPRGQSNFSYLEQNKDHSWKRISFVGYCDDRALSNVTILDFEDNKPARVVRSIEGKNLERKLVLKNGWLGVIPSNDGAYRIRQFAKLVVPVSQEVNRALALGIPLPSEMNVFQLQEYIHLLKKSNIDIRGLSLAFHRHFSEPLACVIVVLIAAPLGVLNRRSLSGTNLVVCAALVFLFFFLQTLAGALGEGGRIDPCLAAWLPGLVFGTLGVSFVFFRNL